MSASWSKLKTCYLKFGTKQIKFRNQYKFLSNCSVHQYRPFCSVCRQVHNQIAPEFAIKTSSRQKSNSSSAGSDQVVIYAYLNWTKSVLFETLLLLIQYWNNNIPSFKWDCTVEICYPLCHMNHFLYHYPFHFVLKIKYYTLS